MSADDDCGSMQLELLAPITLRSLNLTRAQAGARAAAAMWRRLDDDDGMRPLGSCEGGEEAS